MKIKLHSFFSTLAILVGAHQALAQGTAFTYQGRMMDNGANFDGTGQFKFALVTSTNLNHAATAAANAPSGGYITGYTVTSSGNGYPGPTASVTISGGGGSGAAAHANVSGGMVTGITVDNPGNGQYVSAPVVLVAPPPANLSYTTYWSNDGTSAAGSEPSSAVNVAVSNGLFTVVLGDLTVPNMAAIDASLLNQPNLQLRIWFNDGVHGFAALDPAQNLTSAPYATFAITAINLVNGRPIQQNSNGAPNVISGSSVNFVSSGVVGATIAGGGTTNYAKSAYTNSVTASFGTVSGGAANKATGLDATVGGGFGNTAGNYAAAVGGGVNNIASGQYSMVGGGEQNVSSGSYGMVPGGYGNTASGSFSFAAGLEAEAVHDGSFVWSDDSSLGSFSSTAANQFSVRAAGGIVFAGDVQLSGGAPYHNLSLSGGNSSGFLYGSYPYFGDGVHLGYNFYADSAGAPHVINSGGGTSRVTAGYSEVVLAVGSVGFGPNQIRVDATLNGVTVYGTFNNSSDRNAKQDFMPVSSSQILNKVLQLPVSEWSYKTDAATRHIGPMGQDFYSAFNVGTDEKHIAPIDEGGIAFAAIQGLNQKLENEAKEKDAKIQNLEKKLGEMEIMLRQLATQK